MTSHRHRQVSSHVSCAYSRVGIIGRRHLGNLRQLVCRISCSTVHVLSCCQRLRAPVFTNLQQALAARPDVVIVSNPTAYHLQVALPAAEAGCNLFIEKPLSHSWEGVEAFLSVVQKQRLLAMVGFDLRFDPGLCKVKALLEAGCIGHVVAIQAQVGQYHPIGAPRRIIAEA